MEVTLVEGLNVKNQELAVSMTMKRMDQFVHPRMSSPLMSATLSSVLATSDVSGIHGEMQSVSASLSANVSIKLNINMETAKAASQTIDILLKLLLVH